MRLAQLSNKAILKIAQGLHQSEDIDLGETPAEVPDIDPNWQYKEPINEEASSVDINPAEFEDIDNAWVKDNIDNIYSLITELDQENKNQADQINDMSKTNIGFESNIQDRVDVAFQDLQKTNQYIEEIRKSLSEITPTNKIPEMVNPVVEQKPSEAKTKIVKPFKEETTPIVNEPKVEPEFKNPPEKPNREESPLPDRKSVV